MTTVCHMTSAHPADDVRIFFKECRSLAAAGWDVHLVAPGSLPEGNHGVTHHALSPSGIGGRPGRMLYRAYRTYRLARATGAAIFHFHDPELLPYGLLLSMRGRVVIYDAHEDLPRDILAKEWIPVFLRRPVAWLAERVENFVARRVNAVFSATPFIRDRFLGIGAAAIDINNYPGLDEYGEVSERPPPAACAAVCYVGLISRDRGGVEMVAALGRTRARLELAGSFSDSLVRREMVAVPAWGKVNYHGLVRRDRIHEIFAASAAGLVLFHPVPNNINAQPNKLFEYMAAGLPLIASDFPLWRSLIDEYRCGICVDPLDVEKIAAVIGWVLDHPKEAREMGQRGRQAIVERYHWGAQARRLAAAYAGLL